MPDAPGPLRERLAEVQARIRAIEVQFEAMVDGEKAAFHLGTYLQRLLRDRDGLDAAIRAAEGGAMAMTTEGGWIAVGDRLPDRRPPVEDGIESDPILIWETGTCWLAWYEGDGRWRDDEGQVWHPSHWMPLPAPPEEAGDG